MSTADDSPNRIVVTHGIREFLQNNETNALSATIAIGTGVKSEALAVWAEKVQCRHRHHCVGGKNKTGPGGQSLHGQQAKLYKACK